MKEYVKYPMAAIGSVLAMAGAEKAVSSLDDYVSANPPQAQVWQASADYLSEIRQGLEGVAEAASDRQLRQYLTQPVEETLEGVDHVRVNDNNYKDEVFGSDTPVMVLFYSTDKGSQGLAGLVKEIHERFPEIKVCTYDEGVGKSMSVSEFRELQSKYPLEDSPAVLFYENDNGKIEWMGNSWNMNGGIKDFSYLKEKIGDYSEYIPDYMLD